MLHIDFNINSLNPRLYVISLRIFHKILEVHESPETRKGDQSPPREPLVFLLSMHPSPAP